MTRSLVVGVGGCRISKDPQAVLVTYALGSCVAVVIYDIGSRIGGLLHVVLPDSRLNPQKAQTMPEMFADTGVALLLRRAEHAGASRGRLLVWLAGGGHVGGDMQSGDIGRQNYSAVRLALGHAGLPVFKEEVGGHAPRTMRLHVGSGTVVIGDADPAGGG